MVADNIPPDEASGLEMLMLFDRFDNHGGDGTRLLQLDFQNSSCGY